MSCKSKCIIVLNSYYLLDIFCLPIWCLHFFWHWFRKWFYSLIWIFIVHLHFVEHFIHKFLTSLHTLFISLFCSFNYQLCIFLINWRYIMSRRYNLRFRQLTFISFNELIIFNSHSRFFNFYQRMFMIIFLLTCTAKVEAITKNALISDANYSKFIFTFWAHNVMN